MASGETGSSCRTGSLHSTRTAGTKYGGLGEHGIFWDPINSVSQEHILRKGVLRNYTEVGWGQDKNASKNNKSCNNPDIAVIGWLLLSSTMLSTRYT